jgi:hypothetical protein
MAFKSNVPTDTQPGNSQVGNKNSFNANPQDRKGTFLGTKKKTVKNQNTPKGAKTANFGKSNFGKATPMGGGKHNFSRGAPGHSNAK